MPRNPEDTLDNFVEFCTTLRLEDGQPLLLEPFQKTILEDFFEGCTETLIILPKKSGKTSLIAALGLFHVAVTNEAAAFIVASSRDQASLLYKQAGGYVRRSPALRQYFDVKTGTHEIRSLLDGGSLRVLPADAMTTDGVIPTWGCCDEIHLWKKSAMYAVIRNGLGPRDGRMITITTAGEDTMSVLGVMRDAAYELPVQKREGVYRYCRSANRQFVMHEWALSDADDLDNLPLVKQANPASWQTIAKLKERHDSPGVTRSRVGAFRRERVDARRRRGHLRL